MKVLFQHFEPFAFAHGGLQIQITRTFDALKQLGVEVDFLRWYDGTQKGDLLHFFGRIPTELLDLAQGKGMKVLLADLLTEQGSRSASRLKAQRLAMRALERAAPGLCRGIFNWPSYRQADGCLALTEWEARLMTDLFGAPKERVHVVPNGVEEVFFNGAAKARGSHLVCTATITERKRVVELAQAAIQAEVAIRFVGKPYAETDDYFKRFVDLARQYPQLIQYDGAISDRVRLAEIYAEARGFVLLSSMESLSLSALEAAASGCPLLLTDLPWARTVFGDEALYCPVNASTSGTARVLRQFYEATPALKPPPKPCTWIEVAQQIKQIYERLLSTSR